MRVLALADQPPPLDAALLARKMHVDAVVLLGDLDRAWIESIERLQLPRFGVHRSEERRVGKECRSRWSPYH